MTWNEFKELKEGQYVFNDYLGYIKVIHKYKNYIISDDSQNRINYKNIEFKEKSNHFLNLIDDYSERVEKLDYETYEYPKFEEIQFVNYSEENSFNKLMLSRLFRNGEDNMCLNCFGLGYHARDCKCNICDGLGIRI